MNVSSASGRSSSQTEIYTVRFVSVSGMNAAAYVSKKSPVFSPSICNKHTAECLLFLPTSVSSLILFLTHLTVFMHSSFHTVLPQISPVFIHLIATQKMEVVAPPTYAEQTGKSKQIKTYSKLHSEPFMTFLQRGNSCIMHLMNSLLMDKLFLAQVCTPHNTQTYLQTALCLLVSI